MRNGGVFAEMAKSQNQTKSWKRKIMLKNRI